MNRIKEVLEEKGIKQVWLADKVLKTIENEEHQKQALELAIKSINE